MRFRVLSVFVDDQQAAEDFYTGVLGFHKKFDMDLGGGNRWLTVVSAQDPDGPELLLEPSGHPAVKPYRDALIADGIPLLQIDVDDCQAEYDRLSAAGVEFPQAPVDMGTVVTAVFNDTCGNLIQLAQMKA